MGFFSKIKDGLKKTKESMVKKMQKVVNSFTKIDEELFEQLEKDYISGITYSGGDPLFPASRECITALAKEIRARFPDKTQWLYTGFEWEEVKDLPVMQYLDVIVDGRFEIDQKDTQLHWKGSANQKVIDVQESLKKQQIVLHDS